MKRMSFKDLVFSNDPLLITESGFSSNIEEETIDNTDFRRVLFTGERLQLVVMSLQPNEDIGVEVHPNTDQFIRVEQGEGYALIDGERIQLSDGDSVVVPAGSEHNIVNTGSDRLQLYTIYAPPKHPDGTVHATKEEAETHSEE